MNEIIEYGINALKAAYSIQEELFKKGNIGEEIRKGKGRDIILRGDWESEEAVINYLKERKERISARIISEEHEEVDLADNIGYLVVLDGFDGSSGLAANPNARGGTMLAIANNLNPCYNDFQFGGLTDRATSRILYAIKNRGLFSLNPEKDDAKIIQPNTKRTNKIHIDDKQFYPDFQNKITSGLDEITAMCRKSFSEKLIQEYELSGLVSSSAMCCDLVLGKVDAVCGVIAKGVFEPPIEYAMTNEINGIMYGFVDGKWTEIGDKKWLEYGKPLSPLICASSQKIARELIELL